MCLRAIIPVIKQTSYINRSTLLVRVRNFGFASRYRSKHRNGLFMDSLAHHRLPLDVIDYASNDNPSIELNEEIEKWKTNRESMRAEESNYIYSSRLMIHLEEASNEARVQKCNQSDIKLHRVSDRVSEFFFPVESAEMKDLYAMVKEFTKLTIVPKNGKRKSDGQIILKEDNKIFIELDTLETINDWHPDQLYDLEFRHDRKYYLMQHQALDFIQNHQLFDLLINNPKYQSTTVESRPNQRKPEPLEVLENFHLNDEQNDAIANIIQGDYFPLPYLVYGPAGTGKTKTIVAAILSVLRTSDDNILVCTQSNDACDEIAVRLREYIDEKEMLRMYTTSRDIEEIPKSILPCSNYLRGTLMLPTLRRIYGYRVVICTLAMASCLTRAHCSPEHFNYVIIDECASALETMSLVAIAGVCTTENNLHAKIVLAGDPKQLDALTISETADELGYSISFMEHLLNCPLYKRDAVSGKYNATYITQLVKNYRSHPAILHVPNQLFYEGTLEAAVTPQISDLGVHLDLNLDFPVIFKSVQGQCIQPEDDTSSYNVEEITEVVKYIRTILHISDQLRQSDIGVISPYRLQCEYIQTICKRNGFPDVTVGTAERFQGQERKIIIASTVCSRSDSVGTFVSDPQRLNVMLTRAQYLLIVIGDPHTLNTNPHWHEFIKHCYTNGSLIQSDHHFTISSKEVDI